MTNSCKEDKLFKYAFVICKMKISTFPGLPVAVKSNGASYKARNLTWPMVAKLDGTHSSAVVAKM